MDARAGRDEDHVPMTRAAFGLRVGARRLPGHASSSFEGPLDLLLHLIKKNELNIYDIPITLITPQYLDDHRADAGAEPRRRRRVTW